jgi:outer membrane protein insertion porin family
VRPTRPRRISGALALVGLLAGGLAGPPPEALAQAAPPVTQIDIRGQRRVEESAIRARLRSRIGEPFSVDNVREDIKAIYRLGAFDDVQVGAEAFEGGLRLTFSVREKPTVREIRLAGNRALKTDKIKEKFKLAEGSVFSRAEVGKAADAIRKFYEEEGYYLAEARGDAVTVSDREVDVVFQISEGDKFKLEAIRIAGARGVTEKEVKAALATQERQYFFFRGTLKRDELARDRDRIQAFYLDRGYLQVKVQDPEIELDRARRRITVRFTVEEGPPFRVGEVRVTGNSVFGTEEILRALQTKTQALFSREKLQRDIAALTERYTSRGYLYVDVAPLTTTDARRLIVDVALEVSEGRQAAIERIEISGNVRTRDKVIRRQFRLVEGDVFNSDLLQRGRRRLQDLQYFEEVKVDTKRGSAEDKVAVEIEVKEKPTGSFSIGAGFSSVDGPQGIVGLSQRNLFGLGQAASLTGSIGANADRFRVNFSDPNVFDSPYALSLTAFNERLLFQSTQGFDEDRRGVGVSLGRLVFEEVSASLGYRFQRERIFNLAANAPELIRRQEGINYTSAVSFGLVRDSRDSIVSPTTGSRHAATVEVAGGVLGGDNAFTKYTFDTSWYYPLYRRIVGHVRGNIGFVEDFGSPRRVTRNGQEVLVSRLPVQERFFLGGINTIRGFRNFTVSPRDPATGGLLGGNKEYFTNLELIFPLYDPVEMKGLVFFDAGNVFDERQNFELSLRTAAGIGLRFATPIGPIRVEIGWPINRTPGDRTFVPHFTLGIVF